MSAAVTPPASDRTATYEWVLEVLSEEHARLYALAATLAQILEPQDPQNPEDNAPLNEWRLAQVLEERLENVSLLHSIRQVLMGSRHEGGTEALSMAEKGLL